MADKSFGIKKFDLIGSGTPKIESPNNINLNAVNVAISTNATVGGTLDVEGASGFGTHISLPDHAKIRLGNTAGDFDIYYDNNAYLTTGSRGFIINSYNGSFAINVGASNNLKFGFSVVGIVCADDLIPEANGTRDLGLTGVKWKDAYFSGTVNANTFSGSGANLTGLTASQIPNLAASKITSGTLGTDRIPNLASSKITSGTFDAARIPTLNQDTTGNAASADTIDVTAASNSANYFVTFVDQEGSGRSLRGDSGIIYNPSSNDLTVSNKLEGVTVKATSELKAGSYSNISSGTVTSSSSTVTVNTTAVGSADMIEYTIYVSNSTNIQSQKVLIMDNGTTAYFQEFATMSNPNLIVSFSADVNSGNVRLIATKESGITGSVSYKFSKMIIQ